MKKLFIKFLLTINAFRFCLGYSFPLVRIHDGILQGLIHRTRNGRHISCFLSIPYAQPPVGNLRFRNPIPCKPWTGIRMADTDANQCPQRDGLSAVGNEDCLYLNVYTPEQNLGSTKVLLPVMVWIHGGGFISGNSSSTRYGPDYLLDKDIILVSLNYRLGVLGFLSTGDEIAPGNFGLKDQVLALKWVQKNIHVFGGNPYKVTIFGQSSGAVCVSLHLLSDASNGLFHQHIIQSGCMLVPWGYQNSSQYQSQIKDLAFIHACPTSNSTSIVNCLRSIKIDELLDYRSMIVDNTKRFGQFIWTPTNEPESEDAFLTDSPENLIVNNKMKDLPFISGNVGNEAKILAEALYSMQFLYTFMEANVRNLIDYFIGYYLKPHNVIQLREEIISYYFQGSGINDIHSEKMGKAVKGPYDNSKYILGTVKKFFTSHSFNYGNVAELLKEINHQNLEVETNASDRKEKFIEGLTRFVNDAFFFYPQVKFLENRAKMAKSPFYFYIFDYQGGVVPARKNEMKNSTGHDEDLFYLFPLEFERLKPKGTDEYIVDVILDMWTSFAINGKPTSNFVYYPDRWWPYVQNKSYLRIEGNSNLLEISSGYDFISDRFNFWKSKNP